MDTAAPNNSSELDPSEVALIERNLQLTYEERFDQVVCTMRFVLAMRGNPSRRPARVAGFDAASTLRTLAEYEVPFVVIGDMAAAAHGAEDTLLLLEIVPELSALSLEALALALRDLDAGSIDGKRQHCCPSTHCSWSLRAVRRFA